MGTLRLTCLSQNNKDSEIFIPLFNYIFSYRDSILSSNDVILYEETLTETGGN